MKRYLLLSIAVMLFPTLVHAQGDIKKDPPKDNPPKRMEDEPEYLTKAIDEGKRTEVNPLKNELLKVKVGDMQGFTDFVFNTLEEWKEIVGFGKKQMGNG